MPQGCNFVAVDSHGWQCKKKLQRKEKENLVGKLNRGFIPVQITNLFSQDRDSKSDITEVRHGHIHAFQAAHCELVSVGPTEPEV